MIDDSVRKKRMSDHVLDAKAGFDTTAEEDARLRQAEPYEGTASDYGDPYDEQAERITRSMERSDPFKYSGYFSDREKRREFVEGLADRLRGGDGNVRKPAQPKEQPKSQLQRDNDFWSSDEFKQVMPKKL